MAKGNGSLESRVAEHDREIAAIRKLILQGMKMITATQAELRQLAASQRKTDAQLRQTDAKLQSFIDSLQQGRNGYTKRRID